MVIGAFFSEVGTDLLGEITKFDMNNDNIRNNLLITDEWSQKDF